MQRFSGGLSEGPTSPEGPLRLGGAGRMMGAVGARVDVSRRGVVVCAAASVASVVLAGCAADQPLEVLPRASYALAPQPAPIPEPMPEPVLAPMPVAAAGSELRSLVEGASGVVVAGRKLNAGLLQRFYARHGFEPVWAERQAQAEALVGAVSRARRHGLDPARFHAGLLRGAPGLSALERDVLLSDAFLSYADALARGAVPVERRRRDETLTPEPVDVAEMLDRATASNDPAAAIEALAPTTPAYRALAEALQGYRSGASARARDAGARIRVLEVNLERQRWLPRRLPTDRVWVNVADEQLVMYRADRPALFTRVVVGEDLEHNQSPEFRASIDASFYNPPWVVPADIAAAEILPLLERDPEYLARNKMVLLATGEVEQAPGPDAGLGLVMFDMPNTFDVYLHDTPERTVFLRQNRRISHGCIRVQHPRELAALLMEQPLATVDEGIAAGNTTRNALPAPVPVFVVYQTAFLDAGGGLRFRPDFYRRDAGIWGKLQKEG